jgi:hypothetical protein
MNAFQWLCLVEYILYKQLLMNLDTEMILASFKALLGHLSGRPDKLQRINCPHRDLNKIPPG